MYTDIIERIRRWISHTFYVNSRVGNISLNIAAICAVGIILSINANVIVKAANGGKMPVVVEKNYVYYMSESHVLADDETTLGFLGDWITIDREMVFPEGETPFIKFMGKLLNFPPGKNIVASPGDVGMWIGISVGILALFLPFMCALWHYAKKIRVI